MEALTTLAGQQITYVGNNKGLSSPLNPPLVNVTRPMSDAVVTTSSPPRTVVDSRTEGTVEQAYLGSLVWGQDYPDPNLDAFVFAQRSDDIYYVPRGPREAGPY